MVYGIAISEYNDMYALRYNYDKRDYQSGAFEQAIQLVIQQNEAFRIKITQKNSEAMQYVDPMYINQSIFGFLRIR